jgi:hypothetical protein
MLEQEVVGKHNCALKAVPTYTSFYVLLRSVMLGTGS